MTGAGVLPRVHVGIPGFDALVHGGLPEGRSTLVAGSTGTGKTVFGLQFLAAGASRGDAGVLVTFAERPEDMIANAASFGWDLDGLVREGRLAIVDATPEEETIVSGRFDLGGLAARIENALEEVGGKRLFLDPIDALFEEFSAVAEVRRAFAAMLRTLRPLSVTTLIAAERPSEDDLLTRYGAEEFVVDNVVLLRNVRAAERRRRTAEVLKLRGADHHKGEFPFVIDPDAGMEIVPFSPIEGEASGSAERISLGNADLDAMCGGGMYRDSLMMVTGATGTGKTLIGLSFMEAGIAAGERALYLSFEESRWQLERNAAAWDMDLKTSQPGRQVEFISRYPARLGLEDLLVEIKHAVEEVEPTRLVLDSMTAIEHNSPAKAFREFSVGLSGYLKGRGVATMMTTTLPNLLGGDHATDLYLSTIADAILALRYFDLESEIRRAALVLKVRGSQHAKEMYEYEIRETGLHGPRTGQGRARHPGRPGAARGRVVQRRRGHRTRRVTSKRDPRPPPAIAAAIGRDNLLTVINRNADGMLVIDRDGVILLANPAAGRLLGRSADDLIGTTFGAPLTLEAATDIDVIAAGTPTTAELRVVEIDWHGAPAFLASLRDVTDRRRAEEVLARVGAQHEAIALMGKDAVSGLAPDALLGVGAMHIRRVLDADFAAVLVIPPEGSELQLVASAGEHGAPGLLGAPARGSQPEFTLGASAPVVMNDPRGDARFAAWPPRTASAATVLMHDGELRFGVIEAGFRRARRFEPDEITFLQSVANLLAAAVARYRTERQLHHQALHDPLTGLPNRTCSSTG